MKMRTFSSLESDTFSPLFDDQFFVLNHKNLHQLQGTRISTSHLFQILDASTFAQKMGMKMAMDTVHPYTCSESDLKFINGFLDGTMLLVDACNNILLRLEGIRNGLDTIPIGLHYLEGEHEPSKDMLQQAVIALESSRYKDKRHCSKMEKIMSRMRRFGKKLNMPTLDTNDTITPELYKALSGSWAMAFLAIRVLFSATYVRSLTNPSVQPLKVEPRIMLPNELRNKMKVFQKKSDKPESMEELADADLASQTLLKLISAWQKSGISSLRRMAIKAIAGDLRRKKEVLEKTLPLLEDKIEMFYQQIIAIRISLFDLLPKARKEEVLEMMKHSSYEETQMNTNHMNNIKEV